MVSGNAIYRLFLLSWICSMLTPTLSTFVIGNPSIVARTFSSGHSRNYFKIDFVRFEHWSVATAETCR